MTDPSLSGIHSIHQIPANTAAHKLLSELISRASCLRAAIGFWTIDPTSVHANLCSLLASPGSYLVTDFRFPTSIDRLAEMRIAGANVWISLSQSKPKGLTHALMHAKTLVFDFDDGTAEIWTGSHNWTNTALWKLNLEGSMRVHIDQGEPLYQDTIQFLDYAKNIKCCESFEPQWREYYKALQRQEKDASSYLIELEGANAASLAGQGILVLIDHPAGADLKKLQLDEELFLGVVDSSTGVECLYKVQVTQSGALKRSNPNVANTSFSGNRYAFRQTTRLPVLELGTTPPNTVLEASHAFVSLDVRVKYPTGTYAVDPPPRRSLWSATTEHPLQMGLSEDDIQVITGKRALRVKSLIQIPDGKARQAFKADIDAAIPTTLDEKRSHGVPELPSKKLIVFPDTAPTEFE